MKGGFNAHTQKFSKIQLQAIIDNLYQYEAKQKQNPQGSGMNEQLREQMVQLNQTLNSQSLNAQGFNLPEVHQQTPPITDNIPKSNNNLANSALNAVPQTSNQ